MNRKVVFLLALVVGSSTAQAEIGHKEPLKANFHSLIEQSSHEREGIANSLAGAPKGVQRRQHNPKTPRPNGGKVTDFVDVEIGWGEAPQMVDRRFDSVGEPVVVMPACTPVVK